jgi:hypothetical protein
MCALRYDVFDGVIVVVVVAVPVDRKAVAVSASRKKSPRDAGNRFMVVYPKIAVVRIFVRSVLTGRTGEEAE